VKLSTTLPVLLFTLLLAALPATGHSAGSMLRVACEGADVGAEVYVNGEFRGECPLDMSVPPGLVELRVVKSVDASREQVFEQQARIGSGVVKKVEVQLSAPRLTAAAQKVEDARLDAERAVTEARERAAAAEFSRELAAANGGNTKAMLGVAVRYRDGLGVARSDKEWSAWLEKAAAAGDSMGMFLASNLYNERGKKGNERVVQEILSLLELPRENLRQLNLNGNAAVAAFMASDPFFAMPAAFRGGELEYSNSRNGELQNGNQYTVTSKITCRRDGRYADMTIKTSTTLAGGTTTTTGRVVLGGLVYESGKVSHGFLSSTPSRRTDTISLASVHGQPFPLLRGKRFGFVYGETLSPYDNKETITEIECGATTGGVLLCVAMSRYNGSIYAYPSRYAYDTASGCLKVN